MRPKPTRWWTDIQEYQPLVAKNAADGRCTATMPGNPTPWGPVYRMLAAYTRIYGRRN